MVSPSPHHRSDPPHHTILVFKIGNFCKILEPLSHPFFNCQLVSHSPSSFSPTLSMVSPSPQHHSFPQYQQSVILHMSSKSFSISLVSPPTSMLSPSPHQWSDPPPTSMVSSAQHQRSVHPHLWSVLPHINGLSFPTLLFSPPTSSVSPTTSTVSSFPYRLVLPHINNQSFLTSSVGPSYQWSFLPHINGQYFLTSSFPTLLFSPLTSSVSPPTSTVSPFPYHQLVHPHQW